MAVPLKDKSLGTLILATLAGIIIGSYLNTLVATIIPGTENVVKTVFTTNANFGFGYPNPVLIDLSAIKFQLGLRFQFSLMSVLGIILSLYFFRWYK